MTRVTDTDGRTASLETLEGDRATLRLDSGERVDLPADLLARDGDEYRSRVPFSDLRDGAGVARREADEHLFLEAEEHLVVRKGERETGRIRVVRRVETREEVVDEPGWRERVEVEHVPVGQYVTEVASIREEGGVTVIPIYEEVLVVERRLLLKEEVHLRKTREEVREPKRVELRRSVVDVERLDPESPHASSHTPEA
jgi:stress response protein YsnF